MLGSGNTDTIGDDETPAELPEIELGATAVSVHAGAQHTCARLDGGGLRCWGRADFGLIGLPGSPTIGDDEAPAAAELVAIGVAIETVATGAYSCALTVAGKLRCWGPGNFGRLGHGDEQNVGDDETPADAGDVPLP